jgi:hypothetical protein
MGQEHRVSTGVGADLTQIYYTGLDRPARDKPGNPYRSGSLCMVPLLIEIDYFVKKKNIVSV